MESKLSQARLDHIDEVWHRSRQPRLALKEVEKWMKKQKDHPRLELLRASLLFDCQRFDDSSAQCEKILNRKPAIQDMYLLHQLQELTWRQQMNTGVTKATAGANLVKLWNQAVVQQSDKVEALLQWYAVAIKCGHWEDVQRVMAILRKDNPQDKNYHFSYITICHVVSEVSSATNPKLSALNQTLALRFIQASVDQTKSDPDSNTAINSLQDFALLQKLFERRGRHADLLSILEDDRLKLKQKLLHDNQEFGRLKMELLFHAKLWEQLFEYSKQVISNQLDESGTSPSSDTDCRPDRNAYESLLMAGNQLPRRSEVFELLTSSLGRSVPSRDHLLALVSWYAENEATEPLCQNPDSPIPSSLLDACSYYVEVFGSKPCCFSDLRDFIEKLAGGDKLAFLARISKISSQTHAAEAAQPNPRLDRWITLESNRLMFRFLCAAPSTETKELQTTLSEILLDCYSLLDIAQSTEMGNLSAISIPIVTTLVKLHSVQAPGDATPFFGQGYLIQAACLLEKLQTLVPEDRQICLLKLRVYSLLGVPTLALDEYHKLQVRDILNDTISHEIYTRISGSQPFYLGMSGSEANGKDPFHSLCEALDFYDQWDQDLTDFLFKIRDVQVHGMFLDVVEMMEKRRGSFTWRLLLLEKRRMARMRDQEKDLGNLGDIGIWLDQVSDQRAFDTIPNLENAQSPNYEEQPWRGPKTGLYWLATRILNDDTLNVATGQPTFNATDIARAEAMMKDATEEQRKELSAAEKLVEDGWIAVRQLVKHTFEHGPAPQIPPLLANVTRALGKLGEAVVPDQDYELRLPGWEGLERIYAAYELCKACQCFCKSTRVLGSGVVNKNHTDALKNAVHQAWLPVSLRVKLWIESLRSGGQIALLNQAVSGESGEILKKFVGEEEVTLIVADYNKEVVEALERGVELR